MSTQFQLRICTYWVLNLEYSISTTFLMAIEYSINPIMSEHYALLQNHYLTSFRRRNGSKLKLPDPVVPPHLVVPNFGVSWTWSKLRHTCFTILSNKSHCCIHYIQHWLITFFYRRIMFHWEMKLKVCIGNMRHSNVLLLRKKFDFQRSLSNISIDYPLGQSKKFSQLKVFQCKVYEHLGEEVLYQLLLLGTQFNHQ